VHVTKERALLGDDGADVDDAAGFLRSHDSHRGLRAKETAREVGRHDPVPVFQRGGEAIAGGENAPGDGEGPKQVNGAQRGESAGEAEGGLEHAEQVGRTRAGEEREHDHETRGGGDEAEFGVGQMKVGADQRQHDAKNLPVRLVEKEREPEQRQRLPFVGRYGLDRRFHAAAKGRGWRGDAVRNSTIGGNANWQYAPFNFDFAPRAAGRYRCGGRWPEERIAAGPARSLSFDVGPPVVARVQAGRLFEHPDEGGQRGIA
jgi:hypothetical protein